MTDKGAEQDVVRCGYRECRKPLPPRRPGAGGRRRQYCQPGSHVEWASCKDQEAAARAADRAAASEVPLTAFSDAADRLLPRVVDLQGELGTVVEAVTTLREGALARIAAAEEASRKALER